jgi:hypothetical protein
MSTLQVSKLKHEGSTTDNVVLNADGTTLINGLDIGDYPEVRPTLLLDFANAKALHPDVTFSRSSTATYHDGSYAKSDENLLSYSGSGWSASNTTITTSSAESPRGDNGAAIVTGASGDLAKYARRTTRNDSNVGLNNYVFSFYAKGNTHTKIQVAMNFSGSGQFNVDLSDGSTNYIGTSANNSYVEAVGNGWYRIVFRTTYTLSSNGSYLIYMIDDLADGEGAPSLSTGNFYLWGAQLERRADATVMCVTSDYPYKTDVPVIKTAAIDKPRIHTNPATGDCEGLICEQSKTNLVTTSNEGAIAFGAAKKTNALIGPDGAQSAIALTMTGNQRTTLAWNASNENMTVPTEFGAYTFSAYVKVLPSSDPSVRFAAALETGNYGDWADADAVSFDLQNGTVLKNQSNFPAGIEDHGNGWWRIWATAVLNTSGVNTGFYVNLHTVDSSGTKSYNIGDSGSGYTWNNDYISGLGIWGAQFEAGVTATSLIPTSGSSVTRSGDRCAISDAEFLKFYRHQEGTIYIEADTSHMYYTSADSVRLLNLTNSTQSDWIALYGYSGGNTLRYSVRHEGSPSVGYANLAVDDIRKMNKIAFAYATNSYTLNSGSNSVSDNTVDVPTFVDTMYIGSNAGYTDPINTVIKKIAFYPKRLTDAQLDSLTED